MRLDDPRLVRREYASETGLEARVAAYGGSYGGRDAVEAALAAVAEVSPRRVLDVGCGWGAFADRIAREVGAEVIAVDLSPRMVELARARGVDARVGDVQELPFADGRFDCAVANWMLYHVPDVERGVAELARVLRPGGRLVAATNGLGHLAELWALVGRDRRAEPPRFFAETGERLLRRRFRTVDRRDVTGRIRFADREAARRYIAASIAHKHLADRLPHFEGPLVATRVCAVFVSHT